MYTKVIVLFALLAHEALSITRPSIIFMTDKLFAADLINLYPNAPNGLVNADRYCSELGTTSFASTISGGKQLNFIAGLSCSSAKCGGSPINLYDRIPPATPFVTPFKSNSSDGYRFVNLASDKNQLFDTQTALPRQIRSYTGLANMERENRNVYVNTGSGEFGVATQNDCDGYTKDNMMGLSVGFNGQDGAEGATNRENGKFISFGSNIAGCAIPLPIYCIQISSTTSSGPFGGPETTYEFTTVTAKAFTSGAIGVFKIRLIGTEGDTGATVIINNGRLVEGKTQKVSKVISDVGQITSATLITSSFDAWRFVSIRIVGGVNDITYTNSQGRYFGSIDGTSVTLLLDEFTVNN